MIKKLKKQQGFIFQYLRIKEITRYGKEGYEIHHIEQGTIKIVNFEIEGQKFLCLNSGPMFKLTKPVSLTVTLIAPKDISDQFKDFWSTYVQFIGIFAGAFVDAFAKQMFDRAKKGKKMNNTYKNKYYLIKPI